MKDLYTYLECDAATPGNTMGMGNPGEIGPDTLSEPIHTAKAEKEKIVIDEPERKKKKKKRVKSLAESLFDNNLAKQDICYGDVYKLDEWIIPGQNFNMNIIEKSFPSKNAWKVLEKPSWKKFLKRFDFQNEYPEKFSPDFMYMDLFYMLTWITFCCSNKDEIKKKTTSFLKSIQPEHNEKPIGKFEVYPMDMRDDLRMVCFKLYAKDGFEVIPCFTVSKKDWKD